MASVEIEGMKALQAAFKEFPARFVNKAIRKIHRELIKQYVLPEAKRNMAVLTGRMKSRTRVRAAKNDKGGRLPRGIFGSSVQVLKDVTYARWVLLNRKLRDGRIRPGDRTLRKALYSNSNQLRSAAAREYRRALPRIAAETRAKTKPKG